MSTRLITVAITLCALGTVRFVSAEQQNPESMLPEQLDKNYAACNAINLCSTAVERHAIKQFAQDENLSDNYDINRLLQVHKFSYRNLSQKLEIDPKIIGGPLHHQIDPKIVGGPLHHQIDPKIIGGPSHGIWKSSLQGSNFDLTFPR